MLPKLLQQLSYIYDEFGYANGGSERPFMISVKYHIQSLEGLFKAESAVEGHTGIEQHFLTVSLVLESFALFKVCNRKLSVVDYSLVVLNDKR